MKPIWKITEDEYMEYLEGKGIILSGDDPLLKSTIDRNLRYYREEYITAVKQAKAEGKDIPYTVLVQFPYIVRPDLSDDDVDEMVDNTFRLETTDKVLTWMYYTPEKDRKHSDKIIANWF